jgi:hypothetical protein
MMAVHRKDKLRKYCDSMAEKYSTTCSVVRGERSTYYNVNGRVLRVSDHVGSNSSGSISLIEPLFPDDDTIVVHAHTSGYVSVVDYKKAKEIVNSFFYMSSIFHEIVQNNLVKEIEKRDMFDESNAYQKIKDKNDALTRKVGRLESKIKLLTSGSDTVMGIPITDFSNGQITSIMNMVKGCRKKEEEG